MTQFDTTLTPSDQKFLKALKITTGDPADAGDLDHSGLLNALRHFEGLYFEETRKVRDLSAQLRAAHDREVRLECHKGRLAMWLIATMTGGLIGWALWAIHKFGN